MDERHNYYRILHVQNDAPLEIIKTSYRTLMQRMKMHPDLGGDHTKAMLINEAYAALSDPDSREEYDRVLRQRANGMRSEARPEKQRTASAQQPKKRPAARDRESRCVFCNTPHQRLASTEQAFCGTCDSPLQALGLEILATKGPRGNSLRSLERMPQSLPLRFYMQKDPYNSIEGNMLDMSPGGISFSTARALPIGTIVRIECTACYAVARVRHTSGAGPVVTGVEFLTVCFPTHTGTFVSLEA